MTTIKIKITLIIVLLSSVFCTEKKLLLKSAQLTLDENSIHYVTNAEYREFVNYVRDSIAHLVLREEVPEKYLTGDKINWNGPVQREALSQMFFPEHERFYRKKEIETRKLWYNYNNQKIRIYPDTLIWVRNADSSGFKNIGDALASIYNWHPYFKDYPVMGVNHQQAKAYLHWKTIKDQRELKAQKKRPKIKYAFPSADELKQAVPMIENENRSLIFEDEHFDNWEITNVDYKNFVNYIRDSIARRILGEEVDKERFLNTVNEYGEDIEPPIIKWDEPINWNGKEERKALRQMFLPQNESNNRSKIIDKRKLNFRYYWIDYKEAARKENIVQGMRDRSVFIKRDVINVYPDTIVWIMQGGRKYAPQLAIGDIYNIYKDNTHNTGINYLQARAYYIWKINTSKNKGDADENPIGKFIIPAEEEWNNLVAGNKTGSVKLEIPYPSEKFSYVIRILSK